MKRNTITAIVIAIAAIIVTAIVVEQIRHPQSGNLYDIIGIKKDDVVAITIVYIGASYNIADESAVMSLLSSLDNAMKKQINIGRFTGGDWTVYLYTKDGQVRFGLFPFFTDRTNTQILWKDRMYTLDVQLELTELLSIVEKQTPER